MPATAGTAVLADGVVSTFFGDLQGATTVLVRATTENALINVPGLHAEGEFFPIPEGTEYPFRLLHMGIKKIMGKGDGEATIAFGTIAKTSSEF